MNLEKIHWLGHAGFFIDVEKAIYFDPYKIPKQSKPADIIFITHEHYDHCSPEDLRIISLEKTVIVTNSSAADKIKKAKVPFGKIITLSPGENTEVYGIRITAVPSYNISQPFHPRDSGNLGFLIYFLDQTLYYAGDSDFIPEIEGIHCDIAFLPVCGIYAMDSFQAAQTAQRIKPKVVIPMHYGSETGSFDDARKLVDLLRGKIEVMVLEKGR